MILQTIRLSKNYHKGDTVIYNNLTAIVIAKLADDSYLLDFRKWWQI